MKTVGRLRRLLRLDLSALDDAATDPGAAASGVVVVVLSMALFGVGGWLWWSIAGLPDRTGVFMSSVVFGTVFGVALWLAWLLIVYVVLQRLTGKPPRIEALVSACGLAAAPLALGLLMAVPLVSFGLGLLALAAWVALSQAAIERATGAEPRAAFAANLAGFAAWVAVMSVLSTAQQQLAPGPFLAESVWDAVSTFDAARAVIETGAPSD
jgi:hypothetical protein